MQIASQSCVFFAGKIIPHNDRELALQARLLSCENQRTDLSIHCDEPRGDMSCNIVNFTVVTSQFNFAGVQKAFYFVSRQRMSVP
jgi:hypothetical protein